MTKQKEDVEEHVEYKDRQPIEFQGRKRLPRQGGI